MPASSRRLRVFCLDVGQGDCTFILPPDNAPPILFDCKDAHVARMFVRNRPIPIVELSAVVFSHLDDDHIAGGRQFIEDFLSEGGRIRYVYLERDRDISRRSKSSKTAKELIDFVRTLDRSRAVEVLAPTADPAEVDREQASRDWSVRIVGPRQGLELDIARSEMADEPNVHSAILRVEFGGEAMLIGGDAPLASWALVRPNDLPAAAFRIPHHGGALDDGGTPTGWSPQHLYNMVAPCVGVVSVGTRNGHKHPRAEWVRPLFQRTGCRTLCTQLTPRCEPAVETDDGSLVHRTRNLPNSEEAEPAWRHRPDGRARTVHPPMGEVPCAGTISIVVHANGKLEHFPEPGGNHSTHVLPTIARAWCQHGPP